MENNIIKNLKLTKHKYCKIIIAFQKKILYIFKEKYLKKMDQNSFI
jgi:hypothetical protein